MWVMITEDPQRWAVSLGIRMLNPSEIGRPMDMKNESLTQILNVRNVKVTLNLKTKSC